MENIAALPSGRKLLSWTILFYRSHARLVLVIAAIPFAFTLIALGIEKAAPQPGVFITTGLLGGFIAFIAQLALFVAVVDEGQTAVGSFRRALKMFFPVVWVSALSMLAVAGGIFALVIPGIILSILLIFSMYSVFVEGKLGVSALTSSWHYVKGNVGAVLWRLVFITIVLGIAGLIVGAFSLLFGGTALISTEPGAVAAPVPFVSQLIANIFNDFIALPLSVIYSYGMYRALRDMRGPGPEPEEEQKARKTIRIFLIVGAVGFGVAIVFAGSTILSFLAQ